MTALTPALSVAGSGGQFIRNEGLVQPVARGPVKYLVHGAILQSWDDLEEGFWGYLYGRTWHWGERFWAEGLRSLTPFWGSARIVFIEDREV